MMQKHGRLLCLVSALCVTLKALDRADTPSQDPSNPFFDKADGQRLSKGQSVSSGLTFLDSSRRSIIA
jgi:hypothetical protein